MLGPIDLEGVKGFPLLSVKVSQLVVRNEIVKEGVAYRDALEIEAVEQSSHHDPHVRFSHVVPGAHTSSCTVSERLN